MSLRVVIVGSGGRLGAALAREWGRLGDEIIGFRHADLDLADGAALREKLGAADFDVLVNCAALTNVDYCETHENEAHRINAHAVGEIGRICREKDARCIHISTDYVFDGEKRSPYTETDEARPARGICRFKARRRKGAPGGLARSPERAGLMGLWAGSSQLRGSDPPARASDE
jgi:dTDP-4-dehydrorhamnose reductase